MTKNQWSHTGRLKRSIMTFLVKWSLPSVTKLEGHNIYDQFFWSCAICHGHVTSYVDNPTWQYCDQIRRSLIGISPAQIGVFYGPSPTIQPINIFFPCQFWSATWAYSIILGFLFSVRGLFGPTDYIFSFSISGFTFQVGPNMQARPWFSHIIFPILKINE